MDDEAVPSARREARGSAWLRLGVVAVVGVLAVAVAVWMGSSDGPGRPPGGWTRVPYEGLGAWVDAYDWTNGLGGAEPAFGVEDVEAMAEAGVQTLFLQTAHARLGSGIPEKERLEELIDAAHDAGLHVVAWYLPTLVDVDADLRQLMASTELDVDGIAVDLEATDVEDIAERTVRMVDLSRRLRAAIDEVDPDRPIGAITLSAVHLQVVNPAFWPGYPWEEIGATYDVVLPMAYWTIRTGGAARRRPVHDREHRPCAGVARSRRRADPRHRRHRRRCHRDRPRGDGRRHTRARGDRRQPLRLEHLERRPVVGAGAARAPASVGVRPDQRARACPPSQTYRLDCL